MVILLFWQIYAWVVFNGSGWVLTWIVKWTTHGMVSFEQMTDMTTLRSGNKISVVNYPFVALFTLRESKSQLQSLNRLEDVKILIREFVFYLYVKCDRLDLVRFPHEHERILDIICDVWKGPIFLRDWILQRGIGDPHFVWPV